MGPRAQRHGRRVGLSHDAPRGRETEAEPLPCLPTSPSETCAGCSNSMDGNFRVSRDRTTTSEAKGESRLGSRFTRAGSKPSTRARSSKRSKNSSASKAANRPFEQSKWLAAQKLASRYRLVIAPESGVGYLGRTIEMPYVLADGVTIESCAEATLEATAIAIAVAIESGEHPPEPASEGKRELQLNIRLTSDEKSRLDEAARQSGFRSLSDFVRTAALRNAANRDD